MGMIAGIAFGAVWGFWGAEDIEKRLKKCKRDLTAIRHMLHNSNDRTQRLHRKLRDCGCGTE